MTAGRDRRLRIALCGYAGEGHESLEAHGWRVMRWKGPVGFSVGKNQNRKRERIWFSPGCLKP